MLTAYWQLATALFIVSPMFDKFREECGVFGIYGHEDAARLVYLGLYALQHRGQESAGIVSSDGEMLYAERGMGHVNDIFSEDHLARLPGHSAIGHVRYSTAGIVSINEAQPFLVNCRLGQIDLCHNGNLPDAAEVRQQLEGEGAIFSSTSDTEVVLHRIARSRTGNLVEAIIEALKADEGAFSMLFETPGCLIAVRDPRGFRPLCLGQLNGAIVFASETCAFDLIGAKYLRDVEPGEVAIVDFQGISSARAFAAESGGHGICELVHFAGAEAIVGRRSVIVAGQLRCAYVAVDWLVAADVVDAVPVCGIAAGSGGGAASGVGF